MKISSKLISGFLLIACISLAIGIISFFSVQLIFENFEAIIQETTPEIQLLGEIESLSHILIREAISYSFLITSNPNSVDANEELLEYGETKEKIIESMHRFDMLQELEIENEEGLEEEEEEARLLDDIKKRQQELFKISQNLIDISLTGTENEILVAHKTLEEFEEIYQFTIQKRIDIENSELQRRILESHESNNIANLLIMGSTISGFAFAIIFSAIISRRISSSIIDLKNITKEIANGNFDTRIKLIGNDEISNLSSEINKMAKNLIEQKHELIKNEKINAIGHVSSNLAHNLRNPLSVIKATIDIIDHTSNEIDEKTKERLNLVKVSTENMLNQIEDILDFVKQKPLELKNESLSNILDSAIKNINVPTKIKITYPEKDIVINCDSAKLQVVLMNLITNSIDAIEGNGEIIINSNQDKLDSTIEISDNGEGISPTDLEKIFDALYTTKTTGTGLGLSYCKNVVEQHGGSINVSTNPTKFTIVLPARIK